MLSYSLVKDTARQLGFHACGLAPASSLPEKSEKVLRRWLENGHHAGMDYMANNLEKRLNPCLLFEGARTIISVALNYYQNPEYRGYRFSRYAQGRDYHEVMKEKLRQLMALLGQEEPVDGRAFCDTAPINERYWAMRSGIGWCGKNGQLIIPGAGSYFFLGELVLRKAADRYDSPVSSHCGTCRRCIEACPAQALCGDGTLDARRCLSYLTIEHRGPLPSGTGLRMGDCVYGCDCCAEVCPHNRRAVETTVGDFRPSPERLAMTKEDWHGLSVETYRRLFKGSAVKRAKYEGLLRNVRAIEEVEKADRGEEAGLG